MNWLALLLSFQIASVNNLEAISQNDNIYYWQTPQNSFTVNMEMGFEAWNFIRVKGFMESYQFPNGDGFFCPFRIDYGFNACLFYKGLELGFYHECYHPVEYRMSRIQNEYGNYKSRIYLKYETRIEP
jgi:hypothetical protein